MKKLALTCSVLTIACVTALPGNVNAETVTTKTYVQNQNLPDVNEINFTVFDVNNDGSFSMPEVGERLFISFDRDDNGEIDNIEWSEKTMMTITPMEKETFKFIDHNDDGYTDESIYTYETFYTDSGLAKFDTNKNGLSAAEFIGEGFESLDVNNNKMISKGEWKEAYLKTRPEHANPEIYNK